MASDIFTINLSIYLIRKKRILTFYEMLHGRIVACHLKLLHSVDTFSSYCEIFMKRNTSLQKFCSFHLERTPFQKEKMFYVIISIRETTHINSFLDLDVSILITKYQGCL